MADTAESTHPVPPSSAGPSRSSSSRPDMEGLGKFKLASAQPPPKGGGSTYKAKFFVLKETYDAVTAKREELGRELETANAKLKAIQAENDLLLDAMGIVAPSQPSLIGILQQMDSEPTPVPIPIVEAAEPEMYPGPPPTTSIARHVLPDPHPPQPGFAPEHEHRTGGGPIIDAAALNGNGNGHGYTHHAPVHVSNGRSRSRASAAAVEAGGTREYRHREPPREDPVDQEMLDVHDDALLAERELQRDRERELRGE